MKSIKLDASKFTETRTLTFGNASYIIERNHWSAGYHWHVTVNDILVDKDDEHELSCYWDANGVRVSGFISLDAAMAHMNEYAKEPKEYVEDYCQMVRDAFC